MAKYHFGLTSYLSSDLRLWDAIFTSRGDVYIAPLPQLWCRSGFHISIHRDGHIHLKSDPAGVHEDIVDFDSVLKLARKPLQGSFKQPKEGQPAYITLMPFNPFRYLGASNRRNLLVDVDAMSRSTIEIDLKDNAYLLHRMDSIRNMGFARPGEVALIYSPESNEISTYVYPFAEHRRKGDSPFFTMKAEFLNGDPKGIIKQFPILKPLYGPFTQAMNKLSSSGYLSQMSGFPKMYPFRRFTLD